MAGSNHFRSISFGGALLITIFSIMILAIFCSISLISTLADMRLSQKHTDFISSYYAANNMAQDFLAELDEGLKSNNNELSRQLFAEGTLTKEFIINDEQSLVVVVVKNRDTYRITDYKTISTVEAEYDTFFDLFDGTFGEF
jgi:hypothetical protein